MDAAVRSVRERRAVRAVLQEIELGVPVVIVGSWARGRHESTWSDVDLLVIADITSSLSRDEVQVIAMPESRFEERLLAGDDFPQWAMRYGLVISGRASWERIKQSLLGAAPWPDPARNIALAKQELEAGLALLEMGDSDAAQEELRYAASQLARARLLEAGDFPLSRPELVDQLLSAHQKVLAKILGTLSAPHLSHEALETTAQRLCRYSRAATPVP